MKKKERLNCIEAKEINIQSVLIKEGIRPVKETENYAEYLSVFRKETKASFRVSKKLNRWFDHGNGKGGNVIDLVIAWKGLTVSEALQYLSNESSSFSFHQPSSLIKSDGADLTINKICKVSHPALIEYMINKRKLDMNEVIKYCKELHFTDKDQKKWFGVVFRNNSNGFEFRNKYVMRCLVNKNITTILNGSTTLCLFESFIDFLSYRSMKITDIDEDYLILNSTSMVSKSLPLLGNYELVKLYLDNDTPGREAVEIVKNNSKNAFKDCSDLYENFKDLNDFLMNKS